MAFKGWPESALVFYEGLEADNSKAYWQEHKDTYERDVKAPMDALLADLKSAFGESRIFRPYRDTRFSKDKSPYKTAIAARIGEGYVQLSADGLLAGAGTFHMAPDQLVRYREAVAAERSGTKLQALTDVLTKKGLNVHAMESLKTAPKGYPKEHARIELLRFKGLVVSRSWEPGPWLQTATAKKRVVDLFRAAEPLVDWLGAFVGPTTDSRYAS